MSRVAVIGAGASGMLAAIFAARRGNQVCIFEKNEKIGKKLFITGKGRCNLTNACDMDTLFQNVISNSKFLYSAFYRFNNMDAIRFFESLGLKTKTERGNRVFPYSDKSSDVISAMERELKRLKADIKLNSDVEEIKVSSDGKKRIRIKGQKEYVTADAVIIATGGISYPATGSTGDGYRFARETGHKVTDLYPSLVPFEIKESWIKKWQGISLKNIRIQVKNRKKVLYEDFGEMLFTHFGVSGPVILSASSYVARYLKKEELKLSVDLKPALTEEQLDDRIVRDFNGFMNKQFKNSLEHLLPKKMIPEIVRLSGIEPEKKVNYITKEERRNLLGIFKNLELTITGARGYAEAVITKGGVSVKEINPATMESKKVQGLYFVGEVLDLDALTGGFNLQIAWSCAYAAGNAV